MFSSKNDTLITDQNLPDHLERSVSEMQSEQDILKTTEPDNATRLGFLNSYQDQYRQQREDINKAFRFYLLVIGTPFPVLGVLFQIDSIQKLLVINLSYVSIVPLFASIIGFLFFAIHIRQRINSIQLLKKAIAMQKLLMKSVFPELLDQKYEILFPELHEQNRAFSVSRYGADFFLGLVFVFVNSVWITAVFVLLISGLFKPNFIAFVVITIGLFFLTSAFQIYIRQRTLRKFEIVN